MKKALRLVTQPDPRESESEPLYSCETCGDPITNSQNGTCEPCWEVEMRLDRYLKSKKGRARVREALEIADARSRQRGGTEDL